MDNMDRFLRQHSRAINITVNVLLLVLCGIGYALLLVLYFSQGMWTESLMFVDRGSLPPTTAVPLLGVLLTGATSALLTRSVEHSVWIRLLGRERDLLPTKRYTTDEIHQRSQWSVSPFARLLYVFKGHSWLLRISGLLLFGTAILNPILLYGVRPEIIHDEATTTIPRSEPEFSGFITGFDKEIGQDNQMMLASLVSMNNLGAPVSDVCSDASCSVVTRTQAIQAECLGSDFPTPIQSQANVTVCSTFGNKTCVSQGMSGFNFTTGPTADCDVFPYVGVGECPASDFAVILGVWSSFDVENFQYLGHAVDCRLRKGSVEIRQNGTDRPIMIRESFLATTAPFEGASPEFYWEGSYRTPLQEDQNVKPYLFSNRVGTVRDVPMAGYLLGNNITSTEGSGSFRTSTASQQGTNDTRRVARAIEANVDMATLFAFAQAPHAAPLDITETHDVSIWTYDTRVLAVLALPLLATILVLSIYWRVQSGEVVVGYDPLEIARRADEVLMLPVGATAQDSEGKNPRPMSSGEAYSALETQPSSCESGDRVNLVDDIDETLPPRRSWPVDTHERSDGVGISPIDRNDDGRSEAASSVVSSNVSRLSRDK